MPHITFSEQQRLSVLTDASSLQGGLHYHTDLCLSHMIRHVTQVKAQDLSEYRHRAVYRRLDEANIFG